MRELHLIPAHIRMRIIPKQVSGVRWRFLETHRIRLLRTRVIEGTVTCGQSSPISVSFTMFLRCHFSNLLNYVINHLSYIKKGTQTKT